MITLTELKRRWPKWCIGFHKAHLDAERQRDGAWFRVGSIDADGCGDGFTESQALAMVGAALEALQKGGG